MALMPGQLIAAPEPGPTRYGLFRVASGPLDMPEPHAEGGGLRYAPPACGEAYPLGVNCYAPGEAPEKPQDGDNAPVETGVFVALATFLCSAVGGTLGEYQAKVRRRLEANEQGVAERAFATGLDFEGNALGILNLAESAEAISGPYDSSDLRSVIGALLAESVAEYGFRPTLHAPASVEPYATDAGLVVQDGGMLRTPSGALWSFGDYPSATVYVTGQVTIWRAPEIAVYEAFEAATNERLLVAERAYVIGMDCGFAASADFNPLGS